MNVKPEIREIYVAQVPGGSTAIIERIPPVAGVYAWFRGINAPQTDDPESFYAELVARARHTYGVTRTQFIGPSLHVSVTPTTDFETKALPALREACESPEFRRWMRSVIGGLAQFLPPLYVGKAGDLRLRLSQHLRPDSELRRRLSEAGIGLNELILRYVIVPRDASVSGSLEREVEALLSYLLIPGFSVRYG